MKKGGQGGFIRYYNKHLKQPARTLRKAMTEAEQLLWSRLRRKQVCGVQFNRQKPIGKYIVDFYCASASLVIEVDGGQHFKKQQTCNDQERTKFLNVQGLHVIRFDNRQVLMEINAVMEEIYRVVSHRLNLNKIPPTPPLKKGGINLI